MSYTTTSQLEREARSKGDPTIWRAYFNSFKDSNEKVRNNCYRILGENPAGAKQPALEKLVEKGGVWIEQDGKPSGSFHVHGVRDQIGDMTPYTLSWKKDIYVRNTTLFTEAELLCHLLDSDEHLPSAKQFDGTLRAIQFAQVHGNNAETINRLLYNFRNLFRCGMHTSTHIEPTMGKLIHGWGRPNPEHTPLPRSIGAIAQAELIMHLLGTTDTSEQIQERYAFLSDFEPTRVEYLLERNVHVMLFGGSENPVRYCTESDVNSRGMATLVKKTPFAKLD